MNQIKIVIILSVFSFLFSTCSDDFLEVRPSGTLNKYTLANEEGIEALLIGAYSMLDGVRESQAEAYGILKKPRT